MALKYKTGDSVAVVQPVIQGEVAGASIIDDSVQYIVNYVDADGESQSRFFTEEQLTPINA